MTNLLMVFVGGGLGSLCRYAISKWTSTSFLHQDFPFGTLMANALSSLILGFFVSLTLLNSSIISEEIKLLIMVGFCGGFSTYSTFTNDTFQLIQTGNWLLVVSNIFGNLILCLLTLFLGIVLGKSFA